MFISKHIHFFLIIFFNILNIFIFIFLFACEDGCAEMVVIYKY